jgi:hypothetical protein
MAIVSKKPSTTITVLAFIAMLRPIENALGARHPVRTVIEEIVGAVPVAQIVEAPRLSGRHAAVDGVLIDARSAAQ